MTKRQLERLLAQHGDRVYTVCRQFTKNEALAGALAAETFAEAYESWGPWPPRNAEAALVRAALAKTQSR